MYSVLIPTRRSPKDITVVLQSVFTQSVQPEKIFLLIDREFSQQEFDQYQKDILGEFTDKIHQEKIVFISQHNSDFIPEKGVSYVRNYGLKLVEAPLVLMVDDDNEFDEFFVEQLINTHSNYYQKTGKEVVLVPTEMYKNDIRSRGYKTFWYRAGIQIHTKVNSLRTPEAGLTAIQFSSSNCIFGPTKIFKQILFDERMKFAYEDFDFTRRITKVGYPMFVINNLKITHHMRIKTPLDQTYIGNPGDATEKSKNRILFVKNTGNFFQKIIYFLLGLWLHTGYLTAKIFIHAKGKEKKILLAAIWKGISLGIRMRKIKK